METCVVREDGFLLVLGAESQLAAAATVTWLGGLSALEIRAVGGLFASRSTSHCLVESKTCL